MAIYLTFDPLSQKSKRQPTEWEKFLPVIPWIGLTSRININSRELDTSKIKDPLKKWATDQ